MTPQQLARKKLIESENINVLDHGYVRLVELWGSDERIIESARMSTGRSFLGWGPLCIDCIDPNSDHKLLDPQPENGTCTQCGHGGLMYGGDEKLLRRLYRKKHSSPFEFAGATFEIQAPIAVFREWHRHRTQSYSEMSARFAPLPNVNYVPTVSRLMLNAGTKNKQAGAVEWSEPLTEANAEDWLSMLEETYEMCEQCYQAGLKKGVPKELARLIMPVGRYTRMRATANLQNWLRFLRLRLPDDAQWEIRSYAAVVAEKLGEHCPKTMGLFGLEMIDNVGIAA